MGGAQTAEGGQDRGEQPSPLGHIMRCVFTPQGFPVHHYLRAAIAFGFEQDRVHVRGRIESRCTGLQSLGPPDLPPARTRGCIVRHVLRLERRDFYASAMCDAAKGGHQQRLADIRPRALQHDRPCRHCRSGRSLNVEAQRLTVSPDLCGNAEDRAEPVRSTGFLRRSVGDDPAIMHP